MAVTRVAHVAFTGTSSAVNTTGATLFFVTLSNISSAATISDSAGNTWNTSLNTVTSGARVTKGYYVIGPTTNASHTFTIGNANFSDGAFVALDPTSPVFDTQNAGSTSGTTTLNPGSLTPGGATNLIIATLGGDANTSIAIGSSFNIGESAVNTPYGAQGVATAWLEQASATAQNPTWTVGANGNSICSNLVSFTFTGGGGGGGRGLFRTPSLSGAGIGGSFFRDPLQAREQMVKRNHIYVPERYAA